MILIGGLVPSAAAGLIGRPGYKDSLGNPLFYCDVSFWAKIDSLDLSFGSRIFFIDTQRLTDRSFLPQNLSSRYEKELLSESMKKILVVDDEDTAREYVVYILQNNGYQSSEASDGTELLDKALANHPDLIITDILMPNISGYKAIEKLRQHKEFKDTPVIFCSGVMKDEQTFKTLKPHGPSVFIIKPFDKDQLLATIKKLIEI